MNDADFVCVVLKCRLVGIRSTRGYIVAERKTSRAVAGGPVGKVGIEQALVTTVETAVIVGKINHFCVGVQ